MNQTDVIEIDLVQVILDTLKKWRLLLLAMLILAVLFGSGKAISGLRSGPEPVLSGTEREEKQTQLDSETSALASEQTELENKENSLPGLIETRDNYAADLKKANQIKNVTPALISDVLTITENLQSATDQVTSTENRIRDLNASIPNRQANIASLQAELDETKPAVTAKGIIGYAVVGAILGILLVGLYCTLRQAFCKELQRADQAATVLGLTVIGSLHPARVETGNRLARLLARQENTCILGSTGAQPAQIAARLMFLAANNRRVMLTGTVDAKRLEQVRSALAPHLEDGFAMEVAANPMVGEDAPEFRDAAVVQVEELGRSNLRAAQRLAAFLRLGHAELVGAVLL